jgi:hypothetical protein
LQEKHEKNMAAGLEESEKKRTFAGKSQNDAGKTQRLQANA